MKFNFIPEFCFQQNEAVGGGAAFAVNNGTDVVAVQALAKCCVQFYRSELQSAGKSGTNDSQYTGTFGFDRFNEKICPNDTLMDYAFLDHITPDEPILTGRNREVKRYVCSYLTLWPPTVMMGTTNISTLQKARWI